MSTTCYGQSVLSDKGWPGWWDKVGIEMSQKQDSHRVTIKQADTRGQLHFQYELLFGTANTGDSFSLMCLGSSHPPNPTMRGLQDLRKRDDKNGFAKTLNVCVWQ
jgi:hypothetical protein